MDVLDTHVDPTDAGLRGQPRADAAAGRRAARARPRPSRARAAVQIPRAASRAGQAARARAHRPAARSRVAVPRAVAARRVRHVRQRRAGAGLVTGIGRVSGREVLDRRQRRHGQGRHLLPDHRQEAPPRAAGRAREPPAVRLPGRFRRRVPAAAGRGLPRPRALRPDLLQPGADVGRAASRRLPW